MKRSIFFHISLAVCLFAVWSCSVQELEDPAVTYDLSISAKVAGLGNETKADLYNSESEIRDMTLKLYGWENGTSFINGADATYNSTAGKWSVSGSPKIDDKKDYAYFSYANLSSGGASVDAGSKDNIFYTVSDITAAQKDVLLGQKTLSKPANGNVEVNFSHPYASVKFQLGNAVDVPSVSAISLSGVYASGKTSLSQSPSKDSKNVIQYNWTDLGAATATIGATGLTGKTEGEYIATFVVIPQDLSSHNAVITITYNGDKKMMKTLSSDSWVAGYTTTYTLDKINSVNIGFSASNKKVTNNGESKAYVRATITGAWYIGENIVAPWEPSDGTFSGLPGSGWSKSGEFYYYGSALAHNGETSSLYLSYTKPGVAPVAGAALKLDILVQSIPYNVNKTCREAFEAL